MKKMFLKLLTMTLLRNKDIFARAIKLKGKVYILTINEYQSVDKIINKYNELKEKMPQ